MITTFYIYTSSVFIKFTSILIINSLIYSTNFIAIFAIIIAFSIQVSNATFKSAFESISALIARVLVYNTESNSNNTIFIFL
jgi:hypothetical protein